MNLQAAKSPPAGFNYNVMLFAPKCKEVEDTTHDCVRSADNTRPLSMKNTGNEIVSSVANGKLTGPISRSSHHIQQGFVKGRQPIGNPVALDAAARRFSYPCDWKLNPIYAFYDFAAAVPSLFHYWLTLVLVYAGIPTGLLNIIEGIYHDDQAFTNCTGIFVFLFRIASGALQGCPLSGSLFALAIDPFLRAIAAKIDDCDR